MSACRVGVLSLVTLAFAQESRGNEVAVQGAGGEIGQIRIDNGYASHLIPGDLTSDLIIVFSNSVAVTEGGALQLGSDGTKIWANARVLAVGGGGGGGHIGPVSGRNFGGGAGGGAGGFVEQDGLVFDSDVKYDIGVGAGGAGGKTDGVLRADNAAAGENGGDSFVRRGGKDVMEVAKGGGGGGAHGDGKAGGSGGGGSRQTSSKTTNKVGGSGTSGQGYAGGAGETNYRGGGGGGAGGAGQSVTSASAATEAHGGLARSSDITGVEVWYAGGGGGCYLNANNKTAVKYIGGFGGGTDDPARKGGGGNGGGVDGGTGGTFEAPASGKDWLGAIPPQNGADGFGGGGGGGGCYMLPASGAVESRPDTNWAGRGGSGVVIIRLSGFVVGFVAPPTPRTGLIYNGTDQKAVDEIFTYQLAGDWHATDVGVYTYTATIPDKNPWTWEDGTKGAKTFTWKISQLPVDIPVALTGFVFDNTEKIAVNESFYGLDAEDCCYTTVVPGVPLKYCRLTGHREKNAGKHTFTASLYVPSPGVTNFIWRTGTTGDEQVDWEIAQAENAITELILNDWQEGTTPSTPKCTWTWQGISSDQVTYTFAKGEKQPMVDAAYDMDEPPTEAGVYWVRAFICRDSAHEPGNWISATAYSRFCVWRHPSKMLTDYVDITLQGNTSSTPLTDFPVLIRIKEALDGGRGGGVPGFLYGRADYRELRFVSAANWALPDDHANRNLDKDELLPYEVDTWDSLGESLIWVRVPRLAGKTTKIRMYWHRNPTCELIADKPASDTWANGYVGVWHCNSTDADTVFNSTALGSQLDATGNVSLVSARIGDAALVKSGNLVAPNIDRFLDVHDTTPVFTVSSFLRADKYTSGAIMITGTKIGGQASNPQSYGTGWCFYTTSSSQAAPYFSGSSTPGYKNGISLKTTGVHLAMVSPATGNKFVYFNGTSQNGTTGYNSPIIANDLPFQLAPATFSADEVRVSKVARSAEWIRAEYETVNAADYCKYDMVNRPLVDGESARAWVNWWRTEPSFDRYYEPGTFQESTVTTRRGALFYGSITNYFTRMPSEAEVDFPIERGAYLIHLSMKDPIDAYGVAYTYFDGPREVDIEILGNDPRPIAPAWAGPDGVNERILLGNDYTNEIGTVRGQSYLDWEHLDVNVPEALTNNLLPGTEHVLTNSHGRYLWHLYNVYMGNTMTTNDAAASPLMSRQMTLPWSTLSLNSSTNAAAYAEPLRRSCVGQLVMRNVGGTETDNNGACIESAWYTNGIGTIYFDAVNGFNTNAAIFKVVVEVSTNAFDGADEKEVVWERVEGMKQLYFTGTTFGSQTTVSTASFNATGGNGLNRFYRVIAPVARHEPMRFRIRRVTELVSAVDATGAAYADPDDWHAFIVLDNIIASWPTAAAKLSPYGWYDARKTGKEVLGVETAFSVPFPTANEKDLHVSAIFPPEVDTDIISSARIHYRWRYLDASFSPARLSLGANRYKDQYSTIYLDKENGFKTLKPLTLNGAVGDVEFYFDLTAVVPFYEYVDYSGLTIADPTKGYTEEPAKGIECRREVGTILPSRGTDWFVRLREGASDYESIRLYTRTETSDYDGTRTNDVSVAMTLVEDHVWRGFLPTLSVPDSSCVQYRFEALKPTDPGSAALHFKTNYWRAGTDLMRKDQIPGSPMLAEDVRDAWAKAYCDAATGHLMFQIDDRTRTLTVTHADYQDFNGWSDAVGSYFVGSSLQATRRSGASGKMNRQTQVFSAWTDTPDSSVYWGEHFSGRMTADRFSEGMFASSETPNGWRADHASWVARFYQPTDVSGEDDPYRLSLALCSALEGGIQTVDWGSINPRGIGEIRFKTRISQAPEFDSFVYPDVLSCLALGEVPPVNNYTFITRAAFDENANRNFAGAASLSLVAMYRDNVGCYEARWEQLRGDWDGNTKTFKGPARDSQRLSLYRWARDANGDIVPTLLGVLTNNANTTYQWGGKGYTVDTRNNNSTIIPETTQANQRYLPFFISAKTSIDGRTTEIIAGVPCKGSNPDSGMSSSDGDGYFAQQKWNIVYYCDTSANHPTAGMYGVLSSNCEGMFVQPATYPQFATHDNANIKNASVNQFACGSNVTMGFGGDYKDCKDTVRSEYGWCNDYTRMTDFYVGGNIWGFRSQMVKPKLSVMLSDRGKDDWKLFKTYDVEGFGTNLEEGRERTVVVRTTDDKDLRLQASGYSDVVVTDIEFTQWRGDNFGEGNTTDFSGYNDGYGFRSNFVFTSGWIVPNKEPGLEHGVKLSAKRTAVGSPASVRSPLYDGRQNADGTFRGKGLGMIAFDYANAQENVNILVQIATNEGDVVSRSDIRGLTQSIDETTWTTVTNFSFDVSSCTAQERKKGVRTAYLGLHGQVGVMRILLDPKVVEDVHSSNESNPDRFGEIEITKVVCRDEPDLTASDWWGWNVRTPAYTVNDNAVNDNRRIYLPDGDNDADGVGMPIALNCSITEDVQPEDSGDVMTHMPFLQTPTFTNNIVGEVSFLARRYDNGDASQYAEVQLYGATTGNESDDAKWVPLHRFIVSNAFYQAYSYRDVNLYSAFRLAVTGVKGVVYKGADRAYDPAVRVLIDEVAVYEAVRPSMGFRYVYPFRDQLDDNNFVTNVVDVEGRPLEDAQPLAGESWSVQAEIEKRQLPDEIDVVNHKPRVLFHWFVGDRPWGYNNWRTEKSAKTAELKLADGETMVFRGSLVKSPAAVVDAQMDAPTVVQYSADVIYYTAAGQEVTNSLVNNAATEWNRPDWYAPVDYNRENLRVWNAASAYTILDTIAPHRVWINEANIWDGRDDYYNFFSDTNQFVEVAAPQMQSLEGWRLEYIANDNTTNTLCSFTSSTTGDGYVAPLKDLSKIPQDKLSDYRTNDYVFITVQSPKTRDGGRWRDVPGAVDGTWNNFNEYGSLLDQQEPIALRLVRPSRVVEQEIVLEGTNLYSSGRYAARSSATNWLAKLSATMPESHLYIVGNEYGNAIDQSLGVVSGTGATSNDWTNAMRQTPGRLNEGQIVPASYVRYSNGALMLVRASIGLDGHVLQTLGEETDVPYEATVMIKKGGPGTNITYKVAEWWEIGSITTNGNAMAGVSGKRGTFTVNIGAGQSNDVNVVANAVPFRELREDYGLTADDPYTPAVLSWLENGKNYFNKPFEHPGDIHLAEYRDAVTYAFVTNLTLKEMYWLDMDPTTNWVLKAGVVGQVDPVVVGDRDFSVTNFRMTVHMEITNEMTGASYAPYVMRGRQPGQTSADYVAGRDGNWDSATFKITGDIQNGNPNRVRWVPLRWFVFHPNASKPNLSASFDANDEAVIDVWDPKDESNAIYTTGWSKFPDLIWYRWGLDDKSAPVEVDVLEPDSRLSR